jgi:transposase-like protein
VGENSDRGVTKPFSLPYKQKMIERLTGSSAESARRVARETGISQETLSRWLRQARSLPDMAMKRPTSKSWSVDEKVRVLSEAREGTRSQGESTRRGRCPPRPKKKVGHLWEEEDDDTDDESAK